MKKRFPLVVMLLILLGAAGAASGHGGRLDGYGGHYEIKDVKKTYHFHRGPLVGRSFPDRTVALQALRKHILEEERKEQEKKDGSPDNRTVETVIAKVLTPDVVKLPNGKLVRLLGVKRPEGKDAQARAAAALREWIEGKKVLFEFAIPPADGEGYYRGFVWFEQETQEGKKEKVMANVLLAREGLCQVDMSTVAPHAEEFKKHASLESSRATMKFERVYSPTAFLAEGRRPARLAALKSAVNPKDLAEGTRFVEDQILNRQVRVERCAPEKDSDGAELLYLWLDDKTMLNLVLIEKGYASPDPSFHHQHEKEYTEALARRKKQLAEGEKKEPDKDAQEAKQ